MKVELDKKPKNPIIIEGFPGFGFVSTIATEFLIKHLDAKRIGRIVSSKLTPMVAIHKSELIDPLEIYYDKKHNLIILRALTKIKGAEWDLAETITKLAEDLNAKEIISLEGVASEKSKSRVFYYTTSDKKKKKFSGIDLERLKEGIILGVTGVLMLKDKLPLSCLFVEADPTMPDSKAAGEVIKVLDNYLGLKVDYEPLIEIGEEFEKKLKEIVKQAKKAEDNHDKKDLNYLG